MKYLVALVLLALPAFAQDPKIEASENPFTDMTPEIPQCSAGGCDEGEVFDIYCWIAKKIAKAAEIQACIDAKSDDWDAEHWIYCALWDEWLGDWALCNLLTPGQCNWILIEMDNLTSAFSKFGFGLQSDLDGEIDDKLDGFCDDVLDDCCVQGWPGWPILVPPPGWFRYPTNVLWAL